MRLALAFLSSEILVLKKVQKMTILRGCDIKWRIRVTSGSCRLFFFFRKKTSITLTVGKMRLALAFLGSEILVVKEVAKNDHFQRW